jgi:hypothetical protein
MHIKLQLKVLKGGDQLGILDVAMRIILKWILKKYGVDV